jgi:microsomal dipeptidase-like Zn-dependent dipeptidase
MKCWHTILLLLIASVVAVPTVHASQPIITSITAATSGAAPITFGTPGSVIQLHGVNFGATQGTNYVGFCTPPAGTACFASSNGSITISGWSDKLISLTVPADNVVPFGSYLITVFEWDGKISDRVSSQSNGFTFSISSSGPTISRLSAGASGSAGTYKAMPGAEINIYGSGFQDFTGCVPGGKVILAQGQTIALSTQNFRFIGTNDPTGATGVVELALGLPTSLAAGNYSFYLVDASGRRSNAETLSISGTGYAQEIDENGPQIGSLTPNPAWLAPPARVGIAGAGFGVTQGQGWVNINYPDRAQVAVSLKNNLSWSNTQIYFDVPPSLRPGNYKVWVVGVCGRSSNAVPLRVTGGQPVWGFADLHSHPASSYAFGGDSHGQNGIFWGSTGGALAQYGSLTYVCPAHVVYGPLGPAGPGQQVGPTTSPTPTGCAGEYAQDAAMAADLPDCNGLHSGFTLNPVQTDTHATIIGNIDNIQTCRAAPPCSGPQCWPPSVCSDSSFSLSQFLGLPLNGGHGSQGYPSFANWPAASSLEHQQMHVTAIRRAYEGGLRLMIASTTDDQFLSYAWTTNGLGPNFPCGANGCLDATFDYNSAIKQINAINALVNANGDWMQIVKSSSEARQAIRANRLAIILSTEMHELSIRQMLDLINTYGVRHVIPIHLVNNTFGGTALYTDLFNTESNFLNGSFYQAEQDACLTFRLKVPQTLATNGTFGAINPSDLSQSAFQALGYPFAPYQQGTPHTGPGERNAIGLTNPLQINQLMATHVLIDVAHMGEKSTKQTIDITSANNYPVMYSHGGLRDDSVTCAPQSDGGDVTERSLGISQAKRIAAFGGVIGLGTSGITLSSPVDAFLQGYQQTLGVMAQGNGGTPRGVAFGTDMNGLSPQISFDVLPTNYPITVVSMTSPPIGTFETPLPQQPKMGNAAASYDPLFKATTPTAFWNFQTDGIANYGMLPDFIQALSQRPNSMPAIQALYASAEDVIEMWEASEAAFVITPITLAAATQGMEYSSALTASGGVSPYTWSLQAGALPAGITLSNGGVISGKTSQLGAFQFTVVAKDSATPIPAAANLPISWQVQRPPPPPCPLGQYQAVCNTGYTERKICLANGKDCPPPTCKGSDVLKDGTCVPPSGSSP